MSEAVERCALCGRPLGNRWNWHHLVPKTFKGKEMVPMHLICHRKIHSVFSDRELLQKYHTIEALRSHEEIQKFIEWVQNKDPDFYKATFNHSQRKK